MKRILAAAVAGLFLTTFVAAQNNISSELEALVDTERAFARTVTEKGIRDSFLEYFADDAVAFNPAPIVAKDRLRGRRPSRVRFRRQENRRSRNRRGRPHRVEARC